jgi:amino acid transporter
MPGPSDCLAKDTVLSAAGATGSITCSFIRRCFWGAAVTATYIFGKGESGLAENWTYILPFTLIALVLAVVLNVVGVGTGKWLQNFGGICVYLPGILLILLGLYAALTKAPANTLTLSQLKPDLTNLPALNLWATIAFAFAGLELSSTMGHEIHNPRRTLPRSIYIAAPLVALIYICGTGSMMPCRPSLVAFGA